MQQVRHYLTLNTYDEQSGSQINIKEHDRSHEIVVSLTEGPDHIHVENALAQFVYTLPDGTKTDREAVIDNGNIIIDIPHSLTNKTGIVECQVKLYTMQDGCPVVLTAAGFTIAVSGVIYDEDLMNDIVNDPAVYDNLVSAENGRITSENGRKEAEDVRQSAESVRETAEATRTTSEEQREQAEDDRARSEELRAIAEERREANKFVPLTIDEIDSILI